jgi:hypothetical protein
MFTVYGVMNHQEWMAQIRGISVTIISNGNIDISA